MLLFKKKFRPAIRAGEKPNDSPLEIPRHAYRPAELHSGRRIYPHTLVEPIDIDSLTDAGRHPDGFETTAGLQHELRPVYGDKLAQGYQAFGIMFAREVNPAPKAV
jgi:hypothetical protein